MSSFLMPLGEIQPSQLYISEVKLKKVETYLDTIDARSFEPLPIKRIGDATFFTDGHTRAFALAKRGVEEVPVYWDQDNLDWLQYLICLAWCDEAGISDIFGLDNRVVDHSTYRRLWHRRCDVMQKAVAEGKYDGVRTQEVTDPTEKSRIAEGILRSLPAWFGVEEALQGYARGVAETDFFTVQVGKRPVGFISLLEHNEFTSEIYCMGIFEEVHGRGLGTELLARSEKELIQNGKKVLTVKTLGESDPDPDYEQTKRFYRSVGFLPLEESTAIWGPEAPCLLMAKFLG